MSRINQRKQIPFQWQSERTEYLSGAECRSDILTNRFPLLDRPGHTGNLLHESAFLRRRFVIANAKLPANTEKQIRIFHPLFRRDREIASGFPRQDIYLISGFQFIL